MAGHPTPQRLTELATAAGGLGRAAEAAGEELLDSLVVVGDHGTQRAVDDAVDTLVAALRGVCGEALELAHVLGSTGAADAGATSPGARLPVDDHARGRP